MRIHHVPGTTMNEIVIWVFTICLAIISFALNIPSVCAQVSPPEVKKSRYILFAPENKMVRITPQYLLEHGVLPSEHDFSKISVFCLGEEVPIHLVPTREVSPFPWSDLYFFSGPISKQYADFNEENVFYITFGQDGSAGMKTREVSCSAENEVAGALLQTMKREVNQIHLEIPSDSLKKKVVLDPYIR